MLQYLIVCPLVFLAGFVDSIAGGGGLISLPAYIIAGVPAHFAIGTNKLSSTLGTSISTCRYLKQGYLKGKQLILPVVCACFTALAGSYLGSSFSMMVSDTVLKHMMMVVLPIVAFYVLRNKNMGAETEQQALPVRAMLCISMAVAFVIGMYDGFYGPGTGTFLILIFMGLAHMTSMEAAAYTKIVNLSSNIASLVTFLVSGQVILPLGLAAAVFSIAGHYTGAGMVLKNGTKIIRPIILVVLALLFIEIVFNL